MAKDNEIQGLDKALKRLQDLEKKSNRKYLNQAARAGAAEIRKVARANAKMIDDPSTALAIHKNVKSQRRKRTPKNRIEYEVGIDTEGKGGDTFYWWWVEFGTRHTAPNPFMLPALEQSQAKAQKAFVDKLNESIDKELARGT